MPAANAGLQDDQIDAGAQALGERIHEKLSWRVSGAVAKRAQRKILERRTDAIAARERILMHESCPFDRTSQTIDGRLRQLERAAKIGERDRFLVGGQIGQQPKRLYDRRPVLPGIH